MTTEAAAMANTSQHTVDSPSVAATLQAIEACTRAVAELTDGLRPLVAFAPQAPAMIAVVMDSFDEAMRIASDKGVDVERGLLNGAEAALRIVAQLGRALTDTAAAPPVALGIVGLLKALGQSDLQRALGFLVTFAERFGRRLRELPAVRG